MSDTIVEIKVPKTTERVTIFVEDAREEVLSKRAMLNSNGLPQKMKLPNGLTEDDVVIKVQIGSAPIQYWCDGRLVSESAVMQCANEGDCGCSGEANAEEASNEEAEVVSQEAEVETDEEAEVDAEASDEEAEASDEEVSVDYDDLDHECDDEDCEQCFEQELEAEADADAYDEMDSEEN